MPVTFVTATSSDSINHVHEMLKIAINSDPRFPVVKISSILEHYLECENTKQTDNQNNERHEGAKFLDNAKHIINGQLLVMIIQNYLKSLGTIYHAFVFDTPTTGSQAAQLVIKFPQAKLVHISHTEKCATKGSNKKHQKSDGGKILKKSNLEALRCFKTMKPEMVLEITDSRPPKIVLDVIDFCDIRQITKRSWTQRLKEYRRKMHPCETEHDIHALNSAGMPHQFTSSNISQQVTTA
jgi:hypothetical protein